MSRITAGVYDLDHAVSTELTDVNKLMIWSGNTELVMISCVVRMIHHLPRIETSVLEVSTSSRTAQKRATEIHIFLANHCDVYRINSVSLTTKTGFRLPCCDVFRTPD